MIDLHCHLLPGVDDGAPDLRTSLLMAARAVEDGIHTVACTPHAYPGLYDNQAPLIVEGVKQLQDAVNAAGLPLTLTQGADIHLMPDVIPKLKRGLLPTLGGSRYVLIEPSHHIPPPHFEEQVWNILASGYVPVITHPERLAWIERHYDAFQRLARRGVWMQITAGSLTGAFGRRAKRWAERMLDEGLVHLIASDAHGVDRRPLVLSEGREAAARWVGEEEAWRLVRDRPRQILEDTEPERVAPPPALIA